MNKLNRIVIAVFVLSGCVGKSVIRNEPSGHVHITPVDEQVKLQVEGTWQAVAPGRKAKHAIFAPDGTLRFENGLAAFNPARWELHEAARELHLFFPSTNTDALQIFQVNIGQGVKAFHPQSQEVVYEFNEKTSTLNIAGWDFEKPEVVIAPVVEEEPVLKDIVPRN